MLKKKKRKKLTLRAVSNARARAYGHVVYIYCCQYTYIHTHVRREIINIIIFDNKNTANAVEVMESRETRTRTTAVRVTKSTIFSIIIIFKTLLDDYFYTRRRRGDG